MNSLLSLINQIHEQLIATAEREGILPETITPEGVRKMIEKILGDKDEIVTTAILNRIFGLGPLEPLLNDSTITEIMVNGRTAVFVERQGKLEKTNVEFSSDAEILSIINRIVARVNRRIDESSPLVDARLPDGSRVNAIIPPLAQGGPTLTIRRFPVEAWTLEKMIGVTMSREMANWLRASVFAKKNIIISGATGSGKTSLLNALASTVPANERLVTIEDTAEMRLSHPHLVALEARPPNVEGAGEVTIRTLLKNALRMRPDRIIVGEVRGGEALDMLQAMNTGHKGSLTTIHANSPEEALLRLETMTLMAEVGLPLAAVRQQIEMAIDLVIQQERLSDGSRKVVAISEMNHAVEGARLRAVSL